MLFPVLEPSGQDEKGLLLEEMVQDVLVRDPFEALALLGRRAESLRPQVRRGLGQAITPHEAHGVPISHMSLDRIAETFPAGFDLVALHVEGEKIDVFEFRKPGDGPDLSLEI